MNAPFCCLCLGWAAGLALLPSVRADDYRHAATGIVLPDQIATLTRQKEPTDHEKKTPGGGISFGYTGPGVTASVYIYTLQKDHIPADLKSPVLARHFAQMTDAIFQAGQLGYYANIQKLSEGEAAWGGDADDVRSLQASFRFSQSGKERFSSLYLLGFANHFVKVRFTYDATRKDAAEKTRAQFLKELGKRFPRTARNA